jgi:CubicO group peptidase (beta-lactamase class C family)
MSLFQIGPSGKGLATFAALGFAIAASTGFSERRDAPARVDDYLRHRPGTPFNGVVLIARHGDVVFEQGYGWADADLQVRNDPSMRFGIGSLTKPITAAAVMRLVERGRFRLSDPLCLYVVPCPIPWRGVTLEHLLSHTSGIPDYFEELPAAPVESTKGVIDAAIAKHRADPLRSHPGDRYAYSNFGYFLLGYTLEAATGRSWEAVLRAEVFAPASMRDTEYDDVRRVMPRRVRGYTRSSDGLHIVQYHDHAAYAAGGLLSSARDLLRFDNALSRGRIVSESMLREMRKPRRGNYGLGWQVITAFGRKQRNHTGEINGFASHLAHYDGAITVIVLSNVQDEPAKSTACDIAAIMFGLRPSPPGRAACRS